MTRCTQSPNRPGKRRAAASLAALGIAAGVSSAAPAADVDRQALIDALDDEYRAEATYQAVIDRFGPVRPFINIIEAEKRHSAMVKAQLDRLGIPVPRNPHLGAITAPSTLLEACKAGVDAEVENIALYDRLLPGVRDPQVRETLARLQAASRDNHLPAFRRCVARGSTPGRGPASGGRGGGWGAGNRR